MAITSKSDAEILQIAIPMIDHVVKASNQRNWSQFSAYQTAQEANDPNNKASVERQWSEQKFLTSLSLDRDILGVLRREDVAMIVWKQTSTEVEGDYLAIYYLKEIDQEIKEVGFVIK